MAAYNFAFVVPGGQEWILIVLVVVLLFGASKLPKLAKSAGSALGEFRKARYESEQEVQKVKNDLTQTEAENTGEEETEETKKEKEKEKE